MRIVTLLFILSFFCCGPKNVQPKKINLVTFSDTSYLKYEMCNCYLNNGYNVDVVDTSCLFRDGNMTYEEWRHDVLTVYGDYSEASPTPVRILFDADSASIQDFKRSCFNEWTRFRLGADYFKIKSTSSNIDSLKNVLKKQVRSVVSKARNEILTPIYTFERKYNGSVSPKENEQSKIIVLFIDFSNEMVYIDHVFTSYSDFGTEVAIDIGQKILKDSVLSDQLKHLNFPLNYWELNQLELVK